MSLPGPFLAGQRLTAGQLNDATQKTLKSIEVSQAGIIATTSGTTELDVPKLGLGPVPLVNGGLYQFESRFTLQNSNGTDEYTVRVRRDTALTGAIVTTWVVYAPGTTAGYLFVDWADVISAADENVQYFTSFQRASGSGTLSVYGQLSSTNRSGIKMSRAGYSSEFQVVP